MRLSVSLLGPFEVTRDGVPLSFATNAARALLAYLVAEPHPHERTALASLLWPDSPRTASSTNLRQTLARVRDALPGPPDPSMLRIDRQTVQFNRGHALVDVERFETLLAECSVHAHPVGAYCSSCTERLEQAALLCRGEFLAGFTLQNSPSFDDWLLFKREALNRQALDIFNTLTTTYEASADYERMCYYATRQIELNPWREGAHRQLMRGFALRGERNAALVQYESCRRLLMAELGIEPEDETTALYEQIRTGALLRPQRTASIPAVSLSGSPQAWDDVPHTGVFFGRSVEMEQMRRWLLDDRVRLVTILGIGGVGKTALAAMAVRAVGESFDGVLWHSLINAPLLDETLRIMLQSLSSTTLVDIPVTLSEQLTLLMSYLRQRRCLVVLDNVESIMEPGTSGAYRTGYESYGELIKRVATSGHISCLVLTSREQPPGLIRLLDDAPLWRHLHLDGLDIAAGQAMLRARGLSGADAQTAALVQRYSGNPLALKLIAQTVQDMFVGDVDSFLATDVMIFDDVRAVLDDQVVRLSPQEWEILVWLAIEREPVTIPVLHSDVLGVRSSRELVEALRSLQRRSLLEQRVVRSRDLAASHSTPATAPADVHASSSLAFTLQNVIMEYVTERIVAIASDEIASHQVALLHRHALLKTQSTEYVRQTQRRVIVRPLVERLRAHLGEPRLLEHMRMLLTLQQRESRLPSYAPGNILNLMVALDADLRAINVSGLCIWQADLRGVELQGANFAQADLTGLLCTDTFQSANVIVWSPSGDIVAASTPSGTIYLWLASDWQPYAILSGHSGRVNTIAFSPDGRRLASTGDDTTVRVWDVQTTRALHIFRGHTHIAMTVAWSTDGSALASGSWDHTIRIWDAHSGDLRHVLSGHTAYVETVAWSADGSTIASGSWDTTIRIWDAHTGDLRRILTGHTHVVKSVAWHPYALTLASGSWDTTIRIWDACTGSVLHTLRGHAQPIAAVTWNQDGSLLASGGDDPGVRLWSTHARFQLQVLCGEPVAGGYVTFSPDGTMLATGAHDQTVRVWEVHSGRAVHALYGNDRRIQALAVDHTGSLLASGSENGQIHLWDLHTGRMLYTLRGHRAAVRTLAVSAGGTMLASAGSDRTIRIWNLSDRRRLQTLRGHTDRINAIAWSPNDQRLVSAGNDPTLRLWDILAERELMQLHGHTDFVQTVAWSPNGRWIASAGNDRDVCIWDATSGDLVGMLRGHTDVVLSVAWSPDSLRLASGSWDQTIRIWQIETGDSFILHKQDVGIRCVAWSPDGQRVASGALDHALVVWDVASRCAIHALEGHTGSIQALAWVGSGNMLVSGSNDETLRLWDAHTGDHRATLQVEQPYAGLNITGVTGISEAQKAELVALGAVVHDIPPRRV